MKNIFVEVDKNSVIQLDTNVYNGETILRINSYI